MKNVLVFPCGSEIGLELHRCLCHSTHFRLFGASSVPNHGRFVYSRYLSLSSIVEDPDFEDLLNGLLIDNAIDYIIPAHDSVVVKLASMQDGGRLKATAIVPGHEVTSICRSKRATYRLLSDVVKTPKVYTLNQFDNAPFPLFGKPDAGQGSRGAELLPDRTAAEEKLRRNPDTIIMEYLPGFEYTVDCFTDKDGNLIFLSGRTRERIANGIAVSCRKADHPELISIGHAINDRLRMRGGWFFQVRENAEGEAVLLEIAPRIAGTSGFQRVRGINLGLLSLYDRMGKNLSVMLPEGLDNLVVDRALSGSYILNYEYKAAYLDFDDTLYRPDRGVNTDLVKFIFQCHNCGIRVVLLSRHIGSLTRALEKHRLAELFDDVIHITDAEQSKADFIEEQEAIFIDDSYAERRDVWERLRIPTFDISSLEALLSDTL